MPLCAGIFNHARRVVSWSSHTTKKNLKMSRQRYSIRRKLHYAIADLNYSLECFGDHLATENSYPKSIDGFDAIYLYLCRKYGWTIQQCRAMEKEDIRLALEVEMIGWQLPPDAIFGSRFPED